MSHSLNSFSIDVGTFEVEKYYVDPQPLDDGWERLDQYERDLSWEAHGNAYRYREGGTWYLLLADENHTPASVTLDGGAEATWEETQELDFGIERHQEIMRRTLRDNLSWYLTEQLDYWERYGQQFYRQTPSEQVREYDAYDGFNTQIEYSDGFHITVDPRVKFIYSYSIADLLEDSGISDGYFNRTYLDRYCTLMSTDRPAVRLVSIAGGVTVSDKSMEIDGEEQSVLEYLRDSNKYPQETIDQVDPDEPIAKVLFYGRDSPVNAAPSLLYPSPEDTDRHMTNYAAVSPAERWEKTRDFVRQISYISIDRTRCSVSDEPRKSGVGELEYPTLQYGGGESRGIGDPNPDTGGEITQAGWSDGIKAGLKQFGAAKVPKGTPKIGILHPEGREKTANEAYVDICEYIEDYTGYRLPANAGTITYDNPQKFREWMDRFGDRLTGVLVVIDDPSAYSNIRATLDGLPAQAINISTYNSTTSGRFDDVLFNTALGFAAKLGVRPMLFEESLYSDLYLGFSVAGDEVNTAGAVAISGEDGDLVYQTNSNMASGSSTVTKEAIARQLVNNGVSEAGNAIADPIESITIHRNGQFGDGELEGIKAGINQLIESGELPESVDWHAVRVGSNARYRLYGPEAKKYVCPTGAYARLDSRNGVVSTYGWPDNHQGTPHPLHCVVKSASHNPDMVSILRDILALSFMNWGAPTMKIKEPLTTHLPAEMHEMLSSGVRINYPPF